VTQLINRLYIDVLRVHNAAGKNKTTKLQKTKSQKKK